MVAARISHRIGAGPDSVSRAALNLPGTRSPRPAAQPAVGHLVRVPQAGRNFETLGEDPLPRSSLVRAETRGVQSQGTIATIKHLAENNHQTSRMNVDVEVDDRTLHEDCGAVLSLFQRYPDRPHLSIKLLSGLASA
jgi:hypothetical protein